LREDGRSLFQPSHKEAVTMDERVTFSARARLLALGVRFQHLGLWSVLAAHVKIKQKVLKRTPLA